MDNIVPPINPDMGEGDDDGDGIPNYLEDDDGDGVPNYMDPDSKWCRQNCN